MVTGVNGSACYCFEHGSEFRVGIIHVIITISNLYAIYIVLFCLHICFFILCLEEEEFSLSEIGVFDSLLWVDIRFSYSFFRANEQADRSVIIILKLIRWWAVTMLVIPFTFFSVSLGSQLGELQIRCIISRQSRRIVICLMGRMILVLQVFHLDI